MQGESTLTDRSGSGRKGDRRTLINLTQEQHEWLRKEAFTGNVSMSEIVRQAIERSMSGQAKPA